MVPLCAYVYSESALSFLPFLGRGDPVGNWPLRQNGPVAMSAVISIPDFCVNRYSSAGFILLGHRKPIIFCGIRSLSRGQNVPSVLHRLCGHSCFQGGGTGLMK